MAKTQIEIPEGWVCEDCENYDENYDEATESYPLATKVIDNDGYLHPELVCEGCYDSRIDRAIC